MQTRRSEMTEIGRSLLFPVVLAAAVGVGAGCGCGRGPDPGAAEEGPPLIAEDQELLQRLKAELSGIINEETVKYTPLQYNYSEGLLEILDQIEPYLTDQAEGEPPRFLPSLDAEEELEHFREVVRRWEETSGKALRAEIDRLKARVAARPPDQINDPAFQADFSETFDELVGLEVDEMRERSNRAIHSRAAVLLEPYRESSPEVVRRIEVLLDSPQYRLPEDDEEGAVDSPSEEGSIGRRSVGRPTAGIGSAAIIALALALLPGRVLLADKVVPDHASASRVDRTRGRSPRWRSAACSMIPAPGIAARTTSRPIGTPVCPTASRFSTGSSPHRRRGSRSPDSRSDACRPIGNRER
ncbi:hypothetical protein [Tautonia sociabilis]|uniref:Uncharacterized protein n=1 Tax=Tautonia sociabilis TaxID=2080755 RepID=A0A432MKC7_9BACT|nr:hypothetical protein [Tautonia sociabilis]RUL87576.1 hypothetical protein TsocGM_11240 [Tautonia sociabilis]